MPLSQVQRAAVIDYLITNCDCWKGAGDTNILNGLSDDKLVQLKDAALKEAQAITVANAAVQGYVAANGKKAYRVDPETGRWQEADLPTRNAEDDENYPKKKLKLGEDEDEEDEEEEEEPAANRRKSKKARTQTRERPMTLEQTINNLPPELRETVRVAQEVEAREKNAVIGNILRSSAVTNESDKRAHYEWLVQKTLPELNNMLSLLPKAPTDEAVARSSIRSRPHAPTHNAMRDDDLLIPKTINWQDGGDKGSSQTKTPQIVDNDDTLLDGEDDISSLPARWRGVVQNALAVEERERAVLISQLTENVADEGAERRLRQVLDGKKLEELRAMLVLAPKKEPPRLNYFGQSGAAPSANTRPAADVNDEILLPPTTNWAEVAAKGR